jgi:transcription termination/antitermination protein NusA
MDLEIKQLVLAIKTIAEEKNLPEPVVTEIVEQAIAAAWRRDNGDRDQNVKSTINLNTGDIDVAVVYDVVETVENVHTQLTLEDAKAIDKNAILEGTVSTNHKIERFGRVAAQTAKQVVLQRLREAEREVVMAEFEDKIGSVINGVVSRVEGRLVKFELGKAQGIMPVGEQIQGERYYPGQRLKVYLKEVDRGNRGPQLILSRGSKEFMDQLFRAEVPEMESGAVIIKAIAREAGVRSKIAVFSSVTGVDPVGTFVGGHGTRVNAVISEIGEQEKIDITVWSDDKAMFISNALSPTKVSRVVLNSESTKATVYVPQDQLSIAIGKGGQNVRLASKITECELDIVLDPGSVAEVAVDQSQTSLENEQPVVVPQKLKSKNELESSLLDAIDEHGE